MQSIKINIDFSWDFRAEDKGICDALEQHMWLVEIGTRALRTRDVLPTLFSSSVVSYRCSYSEIGDL